MEGAVKGFAKFQHKIEGREVVEPKEDEYPRPGCTFRLWRRLMETRVDHIDSETLLDGFRWSSTEQGYSFWDDIYAKLGIGITLGQLTCDESAEARVIIRSWQSQTRWMSRSNG